MIEILRIVVFEYQAISYDYFINQLSMWELDMILDNIEYCKKQSWEQTRNEMYMVAQVNSTKKIKPTDIMKFPWDKEKKDNTTMTKEDIKRLTEKINKVRYTL